MSPKSIVSTSDEGYMTGPPSPLSLKEHSRRTRRPYDVPTSGKEYSTDGEPEDAWDRNLRLARDMKDRCVGPMPIDEFLRSFLPTESDNDEGMPDSTLAFDRIPKDFKDEAEVYSGLCFAFNTEKRCPTLTFAVTFDENENEANKAGPSSVGDDDDALSEAESSESEEEDGDDVAPVKPGICVYSDDILSQLPSDTNKHAHLGFAEFFIESKKTSDDDVLQSVYTFLKDNPDEEEDEPYVEYSKQRAITAEFGQTVSYVMELFAHQHRTHCFSISIAGTKARLLRWDRAGLIVTSAFDYHENPKPLCQFAWRYSQASDAQRGHDTSVTIASDMEEAIFKEVVVRHIRDQLGLAGDELDSTLPEHYVEGRVCKLVMKPQLPERRQTTRPSRRNDDSSGTTIPANDATGKPDSSKYLNGDARDETVCSEVFASVARTYSDREQFYLISRPTFAPLSFAGRSTVSYWAVKLPDPDVDTDEAQVAHIKDTWRHNQKDKEKEGEVMIELVEAGVTNVSDIFGQADVPIDHTIASSEVVDSADRYQQTVTDIFRIAKWNRGGTGVLTSHMHYRMASVEVGCALKYFKGTKELVCAGRDALRALRSAFNNCGRLHRDISTNNIILIRKKGDNVRVGYLIDWELSCKVDEEGKALDSNAYGTWTFMSIRALQSSIEPYRHEIQDDMESLYYVVLYCSIRWLPHNNVKRLRERIKLFFNDIYGDSDKPIGGDSKGANFYTKNFINLFQFTNKDVGSWLNVMLDFQKEATTWNADALCKYWDEIAGRDLPLDDRFEHSLSAKPSDACVTKELPSDVDRTSSNTSQHSQSSGKRTAEEAGLEGVSNSSKRSR